MDNIAHRLATSEKGLKQPHYAAIQSRLQEEVERLVKELEYNRKWYVSCKKCNQVFYKEILIDGVCRKCTYPEK